MQNRDYSDNIAKFYGSTPQAPPQQNLNASYDQARRQRSPIGQDPGFQDRGFKQSNAAFHGVTPSVSQGRQSPPRMQDIPERPPRQGRAGDNRGYTQAIDNFYGNTPAPSVASSGRNRAAEAFY